MKSFFLLGVCIVMLLLIKATRPDENLRKLKDNVKKLNTIYTERK